MEDINRQTNLFEIGIVFYMLGQRAIVVEKDVVRKLTIYPECPFDKLL